MTSSENKEIARRFVTEVWNGQNLDAIDELYSTDYVGHWFLPNGENADREALKTFVQNVHRGFPDFEMNIEFIHAEDDMVSVGFTTSGTHEGEFMGIPPGNVSVGERPVAGHITSRISDGKIVEAWSTWDALGLLQTIGALPADFEASASAADD